VGNKALNSTQKAKNYCLLLLKFRPRSEKEICNRLKKKKFSDTEIKEALSFLKGKGFIDDDSFAREWIESRIKKNLGIRRLKVELKQKGVDIRIIDANLEKIKKNYSEEEAVAKIAGAQLEKVKNTDLKKAKGRIYGYLLRRGFSPEIIIAALDKIAFTQASARPQIEKYEE